MLKTLLRELFRDAHDRHSNSIVDYFEQGKVGPASAQLQHLIQQADVVICQELFDKLTFRFDG
jgi:hypothetical protein